MPGPYRIGHVPPELLVTLALDGSRLPRSADVVAAEGHVAECLRCADALAGLVRVVAAGRSPGPGDGLTRRPPAPQRRTVAERMRGAAGTAPGSGGRASAALPGPVVLLVASVGAVVLVRRWRGFSRRRTASAGRPATEVEVNRGTG
ncbi:hypothetical protein [Streptomyces sp. MBT33]|uniref:hypothetical protein n=1 Tax=Streptomyces sp. MBT33 TaxID=1488363 RepID=UPI00190AF914|nr:hypothetical protein [Streptomyces sp. MBT33]MBK3644306.1 hypothetical protein [Streptomyces sp. MBT33]